MLIAAHQETARASLAECLGGDYSCVTVKSAREAIVQLEAARFNVAIADITMVGASGLPLCKLIRENFPRTVVVAASRVDTPECTIEAIRQGAFEFITEPFDVVQVTRSVAHALSCGPTVRDLHSLCHSPAAAEAPPFLSRRLACFGD
ncbi:MAG: response regulator [Acidobacteriota bacterium]